MRLSIAIQVAENGDWAVGYGVRSNGAFNTRHTMAGRKVYGIVDDPAAWVNRLVAHRRVRDSLLVWGLDPEIADKASRELVEAVFNGEVKI